VGTEGLTVSLRTHAEVDRAIKKLRQRIAEVQALDPKRVRYKDQIVRNVELAIRNNVGDIFHDGSLEYKLSNPFSILQLGRTQALVHRFPYPRSLKTEVERQDQDRFVLGLPQMVVLLEGLIAQLEEQRADLPQSGPSADVTYSTTNVFVVHGHDEAAKQETARLIERLSLRPVILHEKVSRGRTIIEKFEDYSDVGFAVVLLTPDDRGGSHDVPWEAQRRKLVRTPGSSSASFSESWAARAFALCTARASRSHRIIRAWSSKNSTPAAHGSTSWPRSSRRPGTTST
jgi:CAP12/Pycsar effector protein, TIR domain